MLFALAGNLERYRIAAVRRVQKGAAEPWADLSGRRIFFWAAALPRSYSDNPFRYSGELLLAFASQGFIDSDSKVPRKDGDLPNRLYGAIGKLRSTAKYRALGPLGPSGCPSGIAR